MNPLPPVVLPAVCVQRPSLQLSPYGGAVMPVVLASLIALVVALVAMHAYPNAPDSLEITCDVVHL